ncbi:MAG: acyl-CoA carboxylase subunit beta [Micrococcales bacterium]|nr:acyl-CoA carboxylase subunit beta [Micrococcales bacterium]
MSDTDPRVADVRSRLEAAHAASAAPSEKAAAKLASQGKLYVRDRLALLLDEGSFVEDGRYANALAAGLPADGVVTGRGTVDERPVVVIANDPTVKAGSWGARTVEKIVRATETALREELPVFWLVDSAGARITDQVEMFPGRRGAGHIFHNQVALSGKVPQICCLFGPSAAGGAYIPSFCDLVIMVEGNASMYLGSPRMAEMVVGEKVSLEEMGGARMHCTVSGVGDLLAADDAEAIELARLYFSYVPDSWRTPAPGYHAEEPSAPLTRASVPERESQPFDVHELIDGLVDDDSFFELKPLFAPELVVGFARMAGESVGVVANNSAVKGGVLFTDSADKAARFIWLCDAFSIPLVYLADVPGFMIGSEVERGGIIRHGAKMVSAVASATVPQFCVVVRKAYGAGLYAMGGPGFAPDATIALPTARIAVMGPEAAVNAVYANKIAEVEAAEGPEARDAFVAARRAEYLEDVDLERLAADLVVDQVVEPEALRAELLHRLRYAARRDRHFATKRRDVPPV